MIAEDPHQRPSSEQLLARLQDSNSFPHPPLDLSKKESSNSEEKKTSF